MCEQYELEWYEQARIAERQRREREQSRERDKQPAAPSSKPQKDVKEKDPAPA